MTQVATILARAHQAGITFLDTARAYGASETTIGTLVGDSNAWSVVTKLSPAAMTASEAETSIQASRIALRRPILDGLLLHRPEQRIADSGRLWDFLRRERDAHRLGFLGVSTLTPDDAWSALEDPDIHCVQVPTSLLDQRLTRAGFFTRAVEAGKLIFVRSIYLQGAAHLSARELPLFLRPLTRPLELICEWATERGLRSADVFLAFAASLPAVQVLLGCETLTQFEDNLRTWERVLPLTETVADVARSIPDLAPEVLTPAWWPSCAV